MRIISLALSCAVLALSAGAASAQQQFNGNWSVEVITETGSCDRAYRFPVVIRNGQVSYGGPESVNASGKVTPSGSLRGTLGRGSAQASVVGNLMERSGSGTWTGSGSLNCTGQWRAEKRA
ncbi:MAG TPA: hypothetical protein VGU45_14280 [Microvirga sp.]|jgi:hypothetical protein|nr:hypothetical protein [Microvirga sp.]